MAPRKTEGSDSQGEGGRGRSGSGTKRSGSFPKDSADYKKRRERNNVAVRKSRQLSRQKAKVTEEKVNVLRQENKSLEDKVKLLSKELGVLKDLFLSTASPALGGQGTSSQEAEVLNELKTVETDHKYSIPE